MLLGEYGWVGKRYTEMHTELSHVPFVIRHPAGKAKGQASRYWASHHDIGPTVLSVLGIEKPDAHERRRPVAAARRQAAGAEARPTAPPPTATYVAARDGSWLLISDNQGRDKRLYSLRTRAARNVAARYPQQVRRLWGYIEKDAGPKGLPHFK